MAHGPKAVAGNGDLVPDRFPESRAAAVAVAASLAVFAVLLVVVPPFFQTFDEAKYLGIGQNVLAGRGVISVYGIPFLPHSPLWPVALVLPDRLLGIDALAWGRFLDGIFGVALIGLAAVLAWRYRRVAAALAAAALTGFVYLHDLTRTARLDVPVAALVVLYVVLALRALERPSVGRAVLAGVVLALAFLVKEIALPLAPAPFLAAYIRGRPWTTLARVLGWVLLVTLVGTSWWFVVVADYTGRIYRLGGPAVLLAPLGILLLLVGAGLAAAPRAARSDAAERIAQLRAVRLLDAHRAIVGWLAVGAWMAALLVVFTTSEDARGVSLIDLVQIRHNLQTWFSALRLITAFAGIGGLLALVALLDRSTPDRVRARTIDLVVALLCSAPLVLLVVAVGEPPRNYLAQAALAAALGAGGWAWLARRVAATTMPWAWALAGALAGGVVAGAVAPLPTSLRGVAVAGGLVAAGGVVGLLVLLARHRRPGWARRGFVVLAVLPALACGSSLGVHAIGYQESVTGQARGEAVDAVKTWARANIPAGATIAFGSFLGYEMGNAVAGDHPVVQLAHVAAEFDPTAPLGLRQSGKGAFDDWVAVDTAPRNTNEFQAFRAGTLTERIQALHPAYWVYTTGISTAPPSILELLTPAAGFEQVASWSFPTSGHPVEVRIFRVDSSRIALASQRTIISAVALRRLVTLLEQAGGSEVPAIAGRLLERVEVVPPDPTSATLLDRLRALAARP